MHDSNRFLGTFVGRITVGVLILIAVATLSHLVSYVFNPFLLVFIITLVVLTGMLAYKIGALVDILFHQ